MARHKGGKKKQMSNLEMRRKQYDAMSADKKDAHKRPGSNTK